MRVLQINSFFSEGGPPRIVKGINDVLIEHGSECVLAAGRKKPINGMSVIPIGSSINKYWHLFMSRVFDAQGFASKHATKRLIQKIKEYDPDVIHLHNLHGYYINLEVLFSFLKTYNKPIVWTLHDCWAFTGHCAYFDYVSCEKWKTECFKCPQKKEYPTCNGFDNSKKNYQKKRNAFLGIKNVTIVTPSEWLADVVKKSFLSSYNITVIYNGLDLDVFKPTESDFKKQYGLENKKIVLGVAQVWGTRKGLNTFIELATILDDNYQIVLVGLDYKQKANLPQNIIGLGRTNSVQELAEIYTMADVFVNPSVEETMGLVTVEALACGTPAAVYDATAVPEVINQDCGIVVDKGDIDALINAITSICNNKLFSREGCLSRAKDFNKTDRYSEYVKLYEEMINASVIPN